jgi:hypothetical protein
MREVPMMRGAISTVLKVLLAVVAISLTAIAGLISWLFGLKAKLSATEVATYLRDFIGGSGGDWDWDDFMSVPIANPQLEDIRRRAAAVDLPSTEEGLTTLQGLLAEAERLAKLES